MKLLTCKDASRLQSQSQDRTLHLSERLSLRLHLLICNNCRRFKQQLVMIRQACQQASKSEGMSDDGQALSSEAKARILKELASSQKNRPE